MCMWPQVFWLQERKNCCQNIAVGFLTRKLNLPEFIAFTWPLLETDNVLVAYDKLLQILVCENWVWFLKLSDLESCLGVGYFPPSPFLGTWELLYPYSKLPSCTCFAGSRYLLSDQYLLHDRNVRFLVLLIFWFRNTWKNQKAIPLTVWRRGCRCLLQKLIAYPAWAGIAGCEKIQFLWQRAMRWFSGELKFS